VGAINQKATRGEPVKWERGKKGEEKGNHPQRNQGESNRLNLAREKLKEEGRVAKKSPRQQGEGKEKRVEMFRKKR